MQDTTWKWFGFSFDSIVVLIIIVILFFIVYLYFRRKGPPKIDKGAGDEGED